MVETMEKSLDTTLLEAAQKAHTVLDRLSQQKVISAQPNRFKVVVAQQRYGDGYLMGKLDSQTGDFWVLQGDLETGAYWSPVPHMSYEEACQLNKDIKTRHLQQSKAARITDEPEEEPDRGSNVPPGEDSLLEMDTSGGASSETEEV